MLTSCKLCEQVIEIATLNEHLLSECEVAGQHKVGVADDVCAIAVMLSTPTC